MGGYFVEREYTKLFLGLENEKLYSVADLVAKADDLGLIPKSDKEKRELLFYALLMLMNRNDFPKYGDAIGSVSGDGSGPAWFGLRWESALARQDQCA